MQFLLIILTLGQLFGGTNPGTVSAEELQTMAREILGKVEGMRNQKLNRPLKMGVKSKPQVTAFVQERLEDEYGSEKVAAEGRLLKLQGLLPPSIEYQKLIATLLTEQVAGFYDHTRQELHIANWLPKAMQAPVMAHEIFHAIQDQEWGGGKLIDSKRYSNDAVLAHAALLEGDATIVMINFAQGGQDASTNGFVINTVAATLPMQMSSPQFPVMASAPAFMKQSLIFPYQQGLLFVSSLRQKGYSWAQIRDVYANPPASTEQILHPDRYINGDVPSEVKLPEHLIKNAKTTWTGVTGEFHHRQLLLGRLSITDAGRGAEGWDGDQTHLLEGPDGRVAITLSVWDDEGEAKEFAKALSQAHGQTRPSHATLVVEQEGSHVAYAFSGEAKLAMKAVKAALTQGTIKKR